MATSQFAIRASAVTRHNFQASIDEGLKSSWGARVMRWTWKDGACVASAPGARGTIHLEHGRVVATVHLSMLTLPFKDLIDRDMVTVLKRLGEGHVEHVR